MIGFCYGMDKSSIIKGWFLALCKALSRLRGIGSGLRPEQWRAISAGDQTSPPCPDSFGRKLPYPSGHDEFHL
jgi:hypothetical protein